jgi:hypothetical protein
MDLLAQVGMFLVGQLKKLPMEDPVLPEKGSIAVPLIIASIALIGIVLVSCRPAKRDRVDSND